MCEGSLWEVVRCGLSLGLSSLLAVRRFPEIGEDMSPEERNVARAAAIVCHEEMDDQRLQQVLGQLNGTLREIEQPTYIVADSLDS